MYTMTTVRPDHRKSMSLGMFLDYVSNFTIPYTRFYCERGRKTITMVFFFFFAILEAPSHHLAFFKVSVKVHSSVLMHV